MKPDTPSINWLRIIIQSTAIALLLLCIPLLIIAAIGGFMLYRHTEPFFSRTQTTPAIWREWLETGWSTPLATDDGAFNVLLLGLDSLPNRQGDPVLTDTVLIASIRPGEGTINLISIPRDLWSIDYQTKINSLYQYGYEKNPDEPYSLLHAEILATTGIPIHATVSIDPERLATLIDAVGGVEVNVPVGFTDSLFPRVDVDIRRVHDPKLLYETVSFEAKTQVMSGKDALRYMRSRHGNNQQNTDEARTARQQLVLASLSQKLLSKSVLSNSILLADIWSFYQKEYRDALTFNQLCGLIKLRWQATSWQGGISKTIRAFTQFQLTQHKVPVAQKTARSVDLKSGIIYNPTIDKKKYQGQWVYLIIDLVQYRQYIRKSLGYAT